MNTNDYINLLSKQPTEKMPLIFAGHGNPMNAITENDFRKEWINLGKKLPRPTSILCISAHWLTNGTYVSMQVNPSTLHDFGGFPDELYRQQYPAPGAVADARSVMENVKHTTVQSDSIRGYDHGTWSLLINMFPKADIPVFQLSIDYAKSTEYHYNLAKELAYLRNKGVLVIGSGNIVHNLSHANWDAHAKPYNWAIEFDEFVKNNIENHNDRALINYEKLELTSKMAHPGNDHYLPLIYTIALRDKDDDFSFFNNAIEMGSMGMRSVVYY